MMGRDPPSPLPDNAMPRAVQSLRGVRHIVRVSEWFRDSSPNAVADIRGVSDTTGRLPTFITMDPSETTSSPHTTSVRVGGVDYSYCTSNLGEARQLYSCKLRGVCRLESIYDSSLLRNHTIAYIHICVSNSRSGARTHDLLGFRQKVYPWPAGPNRPSSATSKHCLLRFSGL